MTLGLVLQFLVLLAALLMGSCVGGVGLGLWGGVGMLVLVFGFGVLAAHGIGLTDILLICVPSTLIAVVIAALFQLRIGKELHDDPEYQRRLRTGEVTAPRPRAGGAEETGPSLKPGGKTSAFIFLGGVALVVAAGMFPWLRTVPSGAGEPRVISMAKAIAIVMLAVAAVILSSTGATAEAVTKSKTCQSGITAVIGILGLAWLGDTFISANQEAILGALTRMAESAHGHVVRIGVVQPGAMLGEGVMLDDSPHAVSAVTRKGAVVWQVSRAALDGVRRDSPEVFYRLVGQVARRLSDRLRAAPERLAGEMGTPVVSSVRHEHDSLGERDLPAHAYYGVQTLRATENFPFSGVRLHHYQHFVRALVCVKKAAARANAELGVLDAGIADAIARACDEILEGRLHDQFVVDRIQGGAGTSTNMNANEVIANRALEFLGHPKGRYQHCHPNDHVNCSQSTNDAYPTAVKLGVWFTLRDTVSALREPRPALDAKAGEFADVIKMGRTECTRSVCQPCNPGRSSCPAR